MDVGSCSAFQEPSPEQIRAAELQERREKYHKRMDDLIGAGLLRFSLRDYARPWPEAVQNNPQWWALAKQWNPGMGNLYAFGKNGVGKSALMRYILAVWIYRGHTCADISAPQFAARLTGYDSEALLTRIESASIVFLDDLDKGAWTPRALAYLWEFLDLRNERRRPTLITANMDNAAMHAAFHGASGGGDNCMATAIMRRLQPVQSMPMVGVDLRGLRQFGSWQRPAE